MMQLPLVFSAFLFGLYCVAFAVAPAGAGDGDVNIDGGVDVVDLLQGEEAVLGRRSLLPEEVQHGDVAPLVSGIPQPNGMFDLADVLVISRMVLGGLDFSIPPNQSNIGDSIGEGEAADGTIGEAHHETVWSTGYNSGDSVNSFNERFESIAPVDYYENSAARDPLFNHAVSGSEMRDFVTQAQAVIASIGAAPGGDAGTVAVFLGSNDVCASSLGAMTDPASFEAQFRAGLDELAGNDATHLAQIEVLSVPAIYWLWNAKRSVFWCRVFAWPFVPCENLLDNPSDDCASSTSREDPDTIYPGDGSNCQRRKTFHALIRDTYNPILRDVVTEYRDGGALPNARYVDIFDIRFYSEHVNGGDCFHPSTAGHALLAERAWCRTHWGNDDATCPN